MKHSLKSKHLSDSQIAKPAILSRAMLAATSALFFLSGISASAQVAGWDFFGENTAGVATSPADLFNANLDSSNLVTRGATAAASTAGNSFRTVGFQNNGIATSNTDFFQITLSSITGQTLSLSSIDARLAGTTSFTASPGVSSQFAYSLDGTTFTLIGTPQVTTVTPVTLTQISLAGIPALQNVPASTTVTLRYYASGQTTSGGWGFNSPATGSYGLAVGGTFAADGGGGGPDTTAPTAVTFSPADNATSVNESADLVITFSETIQKGTGSILIKKSSDNTTVETINVTSAAVTATGTTVTINPVATLGLATDYYVMIDAGAIRDTATTPNNYAGISSATTWNFTTRNAPVAGLVISEVYGGGGNSGAAFTNDFVELYNSTASAINLVGYSIQYASATNPFNNKLDLTGSIPAGAYYLIQLASGGAVGTSMPSPSISGTINISATAGKVALVNSVISLAGGGPTDPSVVDFVGYGTTASLFEGTAPTIAPSSSASVTRNASNVDSNDNAADFAVANPPTPQNTTGGADVVAPSINAINPADNSTTASISQNFIITFSEPVVKGTGNIVIYLAGDASVVATIPVTDASVTVAGNTVTINPASDLLNATAYYVNIAAGALKDAAGNNYAGITNNNSWNFTTEAVVVPGTLVAGDIAFVGFTGSSDDHLAFLALKAIPAGEVIRFTDNEWNGSPVGSGGAFNTGEGYIAWTAPLVGGVAQGAIVRLDNLTTIPAASVGNIEIVSGSFNISVTADTVYAYQGGIASPNSVLAVVANTTTNDSIVGTGLTASHTIYVPATSNHYQYAGARSGQGTFPAYLALIADTTTNWTVIPEFQDSPTNLIPNDPATAFSMTSFTTGSSNFSTWASSNGATNDALADHDGDGVRNGVEYFMGQTGSSFTTMPSVVDGSITWARDSSANATYVVKTSTDFVTWTAATGGVMNNGNSVVYTLPTGLAKIFARLEVTIP